MNGANDIIVLSIASFLGNVIVALTGFGMAIIYLLVYQIIVLCGYDGNFRYALFIQALALFCAQPLLLKKAEVRTYARWKILRYFVPITILSTPLGQLTGETVSTELIEIIAGFLVTFVAIFEMYQKRNLFAKRIKKVLSRCTDRTHHSLEGDFDVENPYVSEARDESDDVHKESTKDTNRLVDFMSMYHVKEKLGSGAFSTVCRGTRKESEEQFAIKIIEKGSLSNIEQKRLEEELSVLNEINHENILSLRSFHDEPGRFYLVFDLMSGGDLLTYLNGVGFLSEHEALYFAKTILDALQYLHSRKIVHRDLKPENILLESCNADSRIKVADFGFAKKQIAPDSLSTMCGTLAYVAPEILNNIPYGCEVDMWSYGVLCWVMLVGYQPFRGETDEDLKDSVRRGEYIFDTEFWKDINDEPKQFISALLMKDPKSRLSASGAISHAWLSDNYSCGENAFKEKVFFMIGSQRSGSNWVRTMLNEREDLAGPHPPHIMRDFMPLIERYGDLSEPVNLQILVDHVCTFVERNQVPWTDKHGSNIVFVRLAIFDVASNSCKRLTSARRKNGNEEAIGGGLYLLSIFDAVMTYFTKMNGKRLWMCKSMGMSQYHDMLLEFYGLERLRYIYLVRDPRDVAMSFMKTPVGDCHWHAIITKWTKLQRYALRIFKEAPDIIHKVHYENILRDKVNVMESLFAFIGERRFGGLKRTSSILCIETTEDTINKSRHGRQTLIAHHLSYQFKNLIRGDSFLQQQHQKWKHPDNGLKDFEIQIIESVAHEIMLELGYDTHKVGVTTEPSDWSDAEIAEFEQLNRQGILKMNEDLGKTNADDLARRKHQADALNLKRVRIQEHWVGQVSLDDAIIKSIKSSMDNILAQGSGRRQIHKTPANSHATSDGLQFSWASATQRGYFPDQRDKPNQDEFTARFLVSGNRTALWFGVYDGNGKEGHKCSEFAKRKLPEEFQKKFDAGDSIPLALEGVHGTIHEELISGSEIDSDLSGTTAVTLLVEGDKCTISNVGDSAIILGWQTEKSLSAKLLCNEHSPRVLAERNRIKRAGGVVMTADQHDGSMPNHENWSDGETPRVWRSETDKVPGCAFTRSLGNGIAQTIGVIATPEISEHKITEEDRVFILASDGITTFMNAETCVNIACTFEDPAKAAEALVKQAEEHWKSHGDYIDDITAIVIFLSNNNCETVASSCSEDAQGEDQKERIGFAAMAWTLIAGAASGFLGGLCGIRGPPIILYFLHPPHPVKFNKNTQRATGAMITATNVGMRVTYYFIETLAWNKESYFVRSDWVLYICIIVSSLGGVIVGGKLFEIMKDSRNTLRMILSLFLLLCGISLLLASVPNLI